MRFAATMLNSLMGMAQSNPRRENALGFGEKPSVTTHVLIVDDDGEIRDLLGRFLQKHGYKVSGVQSGREMRNKLDSEQIGLVILDVMLPGEDGMTLCRELRSKSSMPIIMLTAMGDETDRIIGLELGADDYLAKPFNPRELLARMKAVLRRTAAQAPSDKQGRIALFAGWKVDQVRRELTSPAGISKELTAGEYDLLIAFIEHPQRVLTRDQLLDLTRGRDAGPFDRSIDIQVSRLRRKLDEHRQPGLIKTVRGTGYTLAAKVEWT